MCMSAMIQQRIQNGPMQVVRPDKVTIETNAQAESMKYPFKEALLDNVEIVQHYYDMEADESTREKSIARIRS